MLAELSESLSSVNQRCVFEKVCNFFSKFSYLFETVPNLIFVTITYIFRTKCDMCKRTSLAQYHLTMSDATVRNFCTYQCVMQFQVQKLFCHIILNKINYVRHLKVDLQSSFSVVIGTIF